MSEVRNVIIIGSGPAGYTAGLYAGRAMLNPLMFAGYMSGGQLMLTSDIENFPGYPEGIAGPEMMMQLREQAERFGLEVEDKNVDEVDLSERPYKVMVEGETFLTHSIIVCTGAESLWLDAPGEGGGYVAHWLVLGRDASARRGSDTRCGSGPRRPPSTRGYDFQAHGEKHSLDRWEPNEPQHELPDGHRRREREPRAVAHPAALVRRGGSEEEESEQREQREPDVHAVQHQHHLGGQPRERVQDVAVHAGGLHYSLYAPAERRD